MRAGRGDTTSSTGSASAAYEIIAGATDGFYLLSIELWLKNGTSSEYGLGVPAAKGVTPTTPGTVIADNLADTSTLNTTTAMAWATAPTVPASFIRRASLGAYVGAYSCWTWDRGLFVPKNTSLVIWNITANAAVDINIEIDE